MEDSFWLLCPNRTEVRRFQKNFEVEDEFFGYILIDIRLIIEIYGEKKHL